MTWLTVAVKNILWKEQNIMIPPQLYDYLFLILSFLVISIAIFISVNSISSTCFFVTATVSSPYIIAGLTTGHTFPFTLAGNLLSQISPDTFFHPFYLARTLLLTSLPQLSLYCTVDPKYLNSFYSWHFCILHLHCFFVIELIRSFVIKFHRYLVFELLTFRHYWFQSTLPAFSLRSTSFLVFSRVTI